MKRFYSVLLCLCLMFGMMSGAFASESEGVVVGEESKSLAAFLTPVETPEPEAPAPATPVPTEEPAPAEPAATVETPIPAEPSAPVEETAPGGLLSEPAENEPVADGRLSPELEQLLAADRPNDEKMGELVLLEPDSGSEALSMVHDGAVLSLGEALLAVQQGMVARKTSISVVFSMDYDPDVTGEVVRAMARAMMATGLMHTGEPKEGDYIHWHIDGWGCQMGWKKIGAKHQFSFNYTVAYHDTAAQEREVDAAVAALLQTLDLWGKSDYQKICGIYDWMTANIVYDNAGLEDDSDTLEHSAYAAIVEKSAVCQGYALLFYRLMLELGVDVRVIVGDAGGPHAWNIVKLGSVYYNVDSTWDANYAQYIYPLPYEYFLRCPANFTDHIRDEEYTTTDFMTEYPMSTTDYTPPAPGTVLLGDADGNGKINARDATIVLRFDAKASGTESFVFEAADVDGNGKVNARDATYILRYDAGVLSKFPAA